MTEVATREAGSNLVIRSDQPDWTQEQVLALLDMFNLGNAPETVIRSYFHVCQTTGLDPFKRQIHLIERQGKFTPQTSIDGFRIIRDRSQQYDGDETLWCGPDGRWVDAWLEDGPPTACKFVLYLKNRTRPVTAVARWSEYVQTKRDGTVTSMWARMAAHMLAKVAEALAIRKAFPDDTGGLYTNDEMAQATSDPAPEHTAGVPQRKRERSPGLADLEPPVAAGEAYAPDPGVGGGFMDSPEQDPNVEDAQVVGETPPQPQPEAAPAAEQPQSKQAPAPEPSEPQEAAPMDMQPEAREDHRYAWSAKLVEIVEREGFDIWKLKDLYDQAIAAGALNEPVPWAKAEGATIDSTVYAIRMNMEGGRAPLEGVQR